MLYNITKRNCSLRDSSDSTVVHKAFALHYIICIDSFYIPCSMPLDFLQCIFVTYQMWIPDCSSIFKFWSYSPKTHQSILFFQTLLSQILVAICLFFTAEVAHSSSINKPTSTSFLINASLIIYEILKNAVEYSIQQQLHYLLVHIMLLITRSNCCTHARTHTHTHTHTSCNVFT